MLKKSLGFLLPQVWIGTTLEVAAELPEAQQQ
jgi:hypothetical protein